MTSAPPHAPTSAPRLPTWEEMADESTGLVTLAVIVPTLAPGFLLCVPGIVLALLPVILLGLLALAVGLVVAAVALPFLVARVVGRRIGHAVAGWRMRELPMVPAR